MKKIDADYKPHAIPEYNGNPLIEALRIPPDVKTFAQKVQNKPAFDPSMRNLDAFDRQLLVATIKASYFPEPDLYTLYKSICLNILAGYLHRNPLSRDTLRVQHLIAIDPEFSIDDDTNLSECIALIGLSGRGKTEAIKKCLSLIPQVIQHSAYDGQAIRLDQIVHLRFEAPNTKTQKGFILNFFEAVDEAVGTRYYDEWKNAKVSVSTFISEAKKVAFNHFIGVVFVDEIQRCAGDNSKTDRATLGFIDGFFNRIGIPMIVAGTYAVSPLFKTALSTARRLSSGRTFMFDAFKEKDPFWGLLVKSYCHPELLKEDFEFDAGIMELIYFLTQGIPALLSRLMKLAYEEAIDSDEEKITADLLQDVYHSQFEIIHPALEALRQGKHSSYEDIVKFDGFNADYRTEIDKVIDKNLEKQAKDIPLHQDEGLFIDLPDKKSTLIPHDDYRNLQGLDRPSLGAALLDKQK